MRTTIYALALLLLTVTNSSSQHVVRPDTWLRTVKNDAGDYLLKEHISDKIIHRLSPTENQPLINFNPAMPVSGADRVLTSLYYLPKTMISVASSDFSNEQAIWALSDTESTMAILTNRRVADLSSYQYINFPQRIISQPMLSSYIHEREKSESETEYILRLGNPCIENLPLHPFTGRIAEVMLFDRVLSREERHVLESYLAIKYGLTLTAFQSPQYVDAQGHILWDGLLDHDYNYRIAGIGRDDVTGLYQKQSTSSVEPGTVIISAGPCSNDNAGNVTSLPNGAFLLWGDNNAPMVLEEKAGQKLFFQRRWKIAASYWPDSLTTTVIFDRSKINTFLQDNEMYWLVIDREGKGIFNEGRPEYFPSVLSKDRITFHGISWDTDHSAQDHFTLMIGPRLFAHVDVEQPTCGIDLSGRLHISPVGGTRPYTYAVLGPDGYHEQWTSMDKSVHILENLSPGKYTIRMRDAGLLEYEEHLLLAHSAMQGIEMDQQYFLPMAGTLSIDLSDHDFEELRWIFPTGQEVIAPAVVIAEPGIYTLLGEKNGCISFGTIEVRLLSESAFHHFIVYPNPTSTGDYQVQVELRQIGDLEMALYTTSGVFVEKQILQGRKLFTYIGRINGPHGAYIMTLKAQGQAVTIPLIYLN